MTKKFISIAFVVFSVATVSGCSAELAFAQDAVPTTPASDSGGSIPPMPPLPQEPPLPPLPPLPTEGGTEVRQPYPVSDTRSAEFGGSGELRTGSTQYLGGGSEPRTPMDSGNQYLGGGGEPRIDSRTGAPMPNQPRMMPRQPMMPNGQNTQYAPGTRGGGQGVPGMGIGGDGNFGGSWNVQEGDNEDRMAQQEEMMQKQRLTQMKQNIRGMKQGVKQLTNVITRLKKKNIAVPAEAESLAAEMTQAIATVKNASEFSDDVEAATEVFQDKGQDMGDMMQKLNMLEQWTKNVTQMEKQVKRMSDTFAKAKKKKEAAQYPSVITKIESEISAMQMKWQEVKSLASSGDVESAVDGMQDLRETMGETGRSVGFLGQLSSVAKMIRSTTKEIARFEKNVTKLEKKGVNVATVRRYIAEARVKLTELKALGGNTDATPDEYFSLMEEIGGIRQNAVEEFDTLNGKPATSALGASVFQALEWRRMGF